MKIKILPQLKRKEKTKKEKDEKKGRNGSSLVDKVTKTIILSLLAAIPLLFMGLAGVNNLEFNKQAIFLVFIFVALFLYFFGSILLKGEITLRWSIFHLFPLLFLLLALVSTIFSRWPWGSFWGWPLDASESFLTIFLLFVFYLLFSNLMEKKEVAHGQLVLVVVGVIAAIFGGLQLFGKFILPFDFTKTSAFNTIGSFNSWSLFLGALLPLVISLSFSSRGSKKAIFFILELLILFGISLSGYSLAWLEVLVGMFVLLVFSLWSSNKVGYKFLILPAIIFSLALIFSVFNLQIPGFPTVMPEVSPSFKATFEIVLKMLKESPKDLFLGWGPGTFKLGWSKFKDSSLNQTLFWSVRFSRGRAELAEMAGKFGLLGAASFLSVMGLALYKAVKEIFSLKREGKQDDYIQLLGIVCSFVALSAMKFLSPVNLSLSLTLVWWFLLASIIIFSVKKTKVFRLAEDSRESFIFSFLGVLVLVGGISLFYLEGTRYVAEAQYVKALSQTNLEEAKNLFTSAIKLNPQQDIFWQDLSNLYLLEAGQWLNKKDIKDDEKMREVGSAASNAVAAAKRATEINPADVSTWQTRGTIYRELIGLSQGAFDWSVRAHEKAVELEPTNPFNLVELGRTYFAEASVTESQAEITSYIEKSQDYFKKAIALKPDYAQAYYQLALTYEAQGKTEEAITTLETIKNNAPFLVDYDPLGDVGLAFELGVLYYRNEEYTKSQTEFERAVSLNPSYSNARYFLGLVYDKNGNKARAIDQFKVIKTLNPDNKEIDIILANLEKGLPALTGIETNSGTVPLEENATKE